ncbi:MAG: hypothetical protein K2X87_24350 [Gemmataceae bacterium]|nr:hypothetical protein [Gemmataceae bacterium]
MGAQKGLTIATLLDFQKKDQQRAEALHFRPAKYLAENIGTLTKALSAGTLDRFEALFARVNALLP